MAQMPLAKDHNVIEAFPSDRADQAFALSVPPRREWSGWLVANAHGVEGDVRLTNASRNSSALTILGGGERDRFPLRHRRQAMQVDGDCGAA